MFYYKTRKNKNKLQALKLRLKVRIIVLDKTIFSQLNITFTVINNIIFVFVILKDK